MTTNQIDEAIRNLEEIRSNDSGSSDEENESCDECGPFKREQRDGGYGGYTDNGHKVGGRNVENVAICLNCGEEFFD
jgi:hypothetical protein